VSAVRQQLELVKAQIGAAREQAELIEEQVVLMGQLREWLEKAPKAVSLPKWAPPVVTVVCGLLTHWGRRLRIEQEGLLRQAEYNENLVRMAETGIVLPAGARVDA
jgi:hypothetical protein